MLMHGLYFCCILCTALNSFLYCTAKREKAWGPDWVKSAPLLLADVISGAVLRDKCAVLNKKWAVQ